MEKAHKLKEEWRFRVSVSLETTDDGNEQYKASLWAHFSLLLTPALSSFTRVLRSVDKSYSKVLLR